MFFKLKLALRLGKTLAELEQTLTAREFYYWVAFDKLNPIGDERHDWHAAQISSSIYRSQGAKVEFDDCLLKFKEEKKEPVSIFDALSNLLGK
ncbi:MAG: DUF4035 domain-containing protein [Gilliamella sp.]|uniref:phage tail assembly protein T n=1 Tax=Gilliamella sp. BG2 TaxID=3351509 RepID=UPI003985A20A|nr:DUF4035 domain-containing protein [Gilliamella sp.]